MLRLQTKAVTDGLIGKSGEKCMKYLVALTLRSLIIFVGVQAHAAETWLMGPEDFSANRDPSSQSKQWITCAATYEFTAQFVFGEQNKAQSDAFHNLSNGAVMAATMAMVSTARHSLTREEILAEWEPIRAKRKWISLIKASLDTEQVALMAGFESDQVGAFSDLLVATSKICQANLDTQQEYIDLWRNLYDLGWTEP